MITNADYLIQKYAEAREKFEDVSAESSTRQYWRGSMNTYHNLLCLAFPDWAARGTIGYYVFTEQMAYDEALNEVVKTIRAEISAKGY